MSNQNILLLEDDIALSDTIKQFLEYAGYTIYTAYDAFEAKDILYEKNIDLMLLDIKVPHQNGFDFLKEVREGANVTPAIFITSLNSVDDVAKGFEMGCDDYMRKPFALKELLVRVEALLKRNFKSHNQFVDLGNEYSFDIKAFSLLHKGVKVALKTKETKLLALFLKHQNELLTYEQIFEALWEYDETPSQGSLRAYINTLRKIIGKDKIETIKHTGYRYVNE
ncbi:Two-component system response regulator DccR [hydrothermal vent metagenome]|uniref:Two-component system response regulator DccR n=1 Tax=hydrothermal vent metagenome TaxID=652676 RepID=A0A1W1BNC6_9ZZZZ